MRGMPPNREGGLAVERYALLQRVGSTFINTSPAISVFFKPRMTGTRYLKELSDRAIVTRTLTEPYAGIQDWTWKPTVNRFQAVLHSNGVIDLTYDEVSARDGIVGIFPKVQGGEEKTLATLTGEAQVSPHQIKSIKLSAVDGIYLKVQIEAGAPIPTPEDGAWAQAASGAAQECRRDSGALDGLLDDNDRSSLCDDCRSAVEGLGEDTTPPGMDASHSGFRSQAHCLRSQG
jgi:hypothetical protein